MTKNLKSAFTLAEILITLGVIGVVAAVTMPTLLTNIQDRVRQEQVRTVKYKLTKATDTMNSLGKIGMYGSGDDATEKFVDELKKHMSIAKICKSNELDKCWPSTIINAYSGAGTTLSSYNPKNLTTGQSLKALALSSKNTKTVGIVTGDGVPMLLVYSPVCSGFDEAKTYTWSIENGRPVTNATTNCVSAIFDINGIKGPNKIGTDVRTLNSLFGSTDLGDGTSYGAVGVEICNNMKKKYGFQYCSGKYTTQNKDYWAGAIYACDKLGLHLPNLQTLAVIAGAHYGISSMGTYSIYMAEPDYINWLKTNWTWYTYGLEMADKITCGATLTESPNSSIVNSINGGYWSNSEYSEDYSYKRSITEERSLWMRAIRGFNCYSALCVGD